EVLLGLADRLTRRRIPDLLQEVEMAEGVPGLGVGGVLEQARDVRIALDVRDAREVQVSTIGLGLAGERVLQILEALRPLQATPCHRSSLLVDGWSHRGADRRRSDHRTRCAA